MRRFKSIDVFRGMCMGWMFLGHLIEWWIKEDFSWLRDLTFGIFDPIGASGFLFISGVSITLSFRNRKYRVEALKEISYFRVKLSYYIRASFLLLVAIIYNLAIALTINNLSWIWTWFVLMTAAFSLLIVWPLFKVSKEVRIGIGVSIWLINELIYYFLRPFQNQLNFQGVLYHILYNDFSQDPLLIFLPFMIFGTVVGDIFNDLNNNNALEKRREEMKREMIYPIGILSLVLIVFGLLFKFPNFMQRSSFSWYIYSIGIILIIFLILLILEEYRVFETRKKYRVFFFFSYYSFTVYLAHNFLYFIFYKKLDLIFIWIAVIATFFIFSAIIRQIYKMWGWKASLKAVLGRLSFKIAKKIEEKMSKIKEKGNNVL